MTDNHHHHHHHGSHIDNASTTIATMASSAGGHDPHDHNLAEVFISDSGSHSGHGSDSMPHMHMYFRFGVSEYILFEFWKTSEVGGLIGSMIAIFFLAFLYEALKFYREHLYRHSFRTIQYNTVTVPVENGGSVKETQKTVQFTTQRLSVDPTYDNPQITPIFITKENCHCPTLEANAEIEPLPPPCVASQQCSHTTIPNIPNNTNSNRVPLIQQSYKVKMLSLMHAWQTVLHVVQVIISYFLMLIFMTYNVWLCLAVTLGAGFGYFFFGWKKSLVVDITEHCH